jgi:hypothetical protein
MEGELIACKNAGEKNSDKVALSSALLAKTKIELQDVIKERDNQMTALATLLAKGKKVKNITKIDK